jgi:hypothetical protein
MENASGMSTFAQFQSSPGQRPLSNRLVNGHFLASSITFSRVLPSIVNIFPLRRSPARWPNQFLRHRSFPDG